MNTRVRIGFGFILAVLTVILAYTLAWAQNDPIAKSKKLAVYITGVNLEIVADLNKSEIVSVDVASPDDVLAHTDSTEAIITLSPSPELKDGLYRYDIQIVDSESGIITDRLAGDFKIKYGQIIAPLEEKGRVSQNLLKGLGRFFAWVVNQVFGLLASDSYAADVVVSDGIADLYFDDINNNTPSWGNYDWVVRVSTANSTSSGLFDISNIRYSSTPYLRFYDAGSNGGNSFMLDSSGNLRFANNGMFFDRTNKRLGIGTTTPAYMLDVVGLTRIRLRNNTSNTARTIQMRVDGSNTDIHAENAHLYLRTDWNDATPHNIYLIPDTHGKVGVGTETPSQKLDVSGNVLSRGNYSFMAQGLNPGFWLDETGPGNKGLYYVLDDKVLQIQRRAQGFGIFEASIMKIYLEAPTDSLFINYNGYVGFGRNPSHPIHSLTNAYLSAGGAWVNASSREYKDNIKPLTSDEAFNALKGLNPVTFTAKVDPEEKHVGFVAEDVPELVATKDRKSLSPMDIVAVLTKVVQEQEKEIRALRAENQEIKAELKDRIIALERQLKLMNSVASR